MSGQDDTKYDSCKQRRFLRWPTVKSCPPIHPLTHPSTPFSFFMILLSTLSNIDHMTISSLGQGVSTIKAKRKSLKGQPEKCEQTLLSHLERISPVPNRSRKRSLAPRSAPPYTYDAQSFFLLPCLGIPTKQATPFQHRAIAPAPFKLAT